MDKETEILIGNANSMLHWEAIKYAKERAIREFDFGGLWSTFECELDPRKKAINNFKQNFGGNLIRCYSYSKEYSFTYKMISGIVKIYKNWNGISNKY